MIDIGRILSPVIADHCFCDGGKQPVGLEYHSGK